MADEPSLHFAQQCLAWSQALAACAQCLDADRWRELLDALIQVARDAAAIQLDADPLVQQMLSAELPLTLSYQFPEIRSCRELSASARSSISYAAAELLDDRGLPHARHLRFMRPLLACWTRCGLLARETKFSCFDETAQTQLEWLLRQSLRLTTHDGNQPLIGGQPVTWDKSFVEAALELSRNPDDAVIAAQIVRARNRRSNRAGQAAEQPEPAYHSEWSEVAILRTNWSGKPEMLTVTYSDRSLQSELNCGLATIWSGNCQPVIRVNETDLEPQTNWEEICWYTDKDADYLELEMEFAGGWKIQRQLLLAREDHFLFVGDAIIGGQRSRIEYQSTLPLAEGIGFDGAQETREGFLYGTKRLGTVLPLALPEWRAEGTEDRLGAGGTGFELRQFQYGSALYAPLFIDLQPSRTSQESTWRQLTVAEHLEIQPRNVAVGYRVQIGKTQWLIYRSLAAKANRTVLGQNFVNEFFCGRFTNKGTTKELLQIE
jgi:hypothetical protein